MPFIRIEKVRFLLSPLKLRSGGIMVNVSRGSVAALGERQLRFNECWEGETLMT
jgi:hypothetical protein